MFVPNLSLTSTKKENTAEFLGGNQHRIVCPLSLRLMFNVQTVPNVSQTLLKAEMYQEVFGKLSVL